VDSWKYYAITHRDHVILNPLSSVKLDEMIGLLDLPQGARVLDIACGKGEFLARLAERHGVRGVGVDLSPHYVRDARVLIEARVPDADIEILEMDGADYAGEPGSFDLASCIGATWTFGGHRGTLKALSRFVAPGGQVLVGEVHWREEPDPAYLEWSGMRRQEFATHRENVEAGIAEDLVPLYTLVGSQDDFDRYEALQWRAAERYCREHPEDPDLPALVERVGRTRHEYLAWGRETVGWSLYLFRKP
jgi:SAM-dependent methyltransferase